MKIYLKIVSLDKYLIYKGCIQFKGTRNLPWQFYRASFSLPIYSASFETNIERNVKITSDVSMNLRVLQKVKKALWVKVSLESPYWLKPLLIIHFGEHSLWKWIVQVNLAKVVCWDQPVYWKIITTRSTT